MSNKTTRVTTMPYAPVVKWPGSKRSVAVQLAQLMPQSDLYLEPFLGGGALLPLRPCERAIAGDTVPELMALWKLIRTRPDTVAAEYSSRWTRLQSTGHTAFYAIRDDFNRDRSPHDLLFLSRTCVNGLIRFNKSGDFNNSLHHTRPGIDPKRLAAILARWSVALQGVDLGTRDYRETLAGAGSGSIAFLDPPYGATRGRYHPVGFSQSDLFNELERLNSLGAKWILTYDGSAGARDYAHRLPAELYKTQMVVPTGNSPFTRLMGTSLDEVNESVYLNFDPTV